MNISAKNKIIQDILQRKIVRYFFVALMSTLTDILILWTLNEYTTINYLISATLGYLIGTYVNYILGVIFVFESESKHSKLKEIIFVYAVTLTSAGVNVAVLDFIHQCHGYSLVIAKFISLGICFFYNFSMRHFFIFGETD